ncbi:DUF5105 domain-containing protein [Bacillus sp. DX4.1]|uniref:DUF5105 domain-containing protein n=1 Tax=Bacillus sp. DX4.1 TaxID=3055867 RepID=UPI0025A0703D|nr:DUF5105 domain-containing protein [Bacillus sp. DX4.1]MDM5190348.1 DUF5105 domain-containing protein [Bacillus sp. DX4.1]
MQMKKFIGICLATLLTVGFVSGCNSSKSSTEVKESKESKEKKVYEVGDTAKSKNVELELESAAFVLPEQYSKPTNEKILKVEVSLKNTGDKTIQIMPTDFSLYENDEKMKPLYTSDQDFLKSGDVDKGKKVSGSIYYYVNEASSYELVYKKYIIDPQKDKEEKVSFKIQGKELVKKSKELQKPAEALTAYLNAAYYNKDVEKINDLTGEEGAQFVRDVEDGFKESTVRTYSNRINEQALINYFNVLKVAFQQNVKFETKVLSTRDDKAQVELKAKPLMLSELKPKIESEGRMIASQNPNITQDELENRLFDYLIKIIPEAKTSGTEEIVTINMIKFGKNQWRLDTNSANEIMKVFVK